MRSRLTIEEAKDRYDNIFKLRGLLMEKRKASTNNEEKDSITKQISTLTTKLTYYKKNFNLFEKPTITVREQQKLLFNNSPTKLKLQEIENKAQILLQNAKTDEERKSIEERLSYVRLRASYGV